MRSKLMNSRKKSNVLVSMQTLQDAVQIANSLVNAWQQEGGDEPRIQQAQMIIEHLSGIQDDRMLDDAVNPAEARRVKEEVDMISKWRREARPPRVSQTAPAAVPVTSAAGNDNFVSDRDDKGEPKSPSRIDVNRLGAKKEKKEAEAVAPVPAPVAPAVPAAAPAAPAAAPLGDGTLDSLFEQLPSEFVAQLVKDLTGLEGFEQNKSVQSAVERLAEILTNRPVEAAPVEPAKAASRVANANGGFVHNDETMDVEEGSVPEIGEAHSKLDDNTGIKRPATELPSKFAGDMSLAKAVKEAEKLGNELKKMYLEAKPLTEVNDSRPVREAVESIFRAGDMFGEAVKTLNKQLMQEEAEQQAAEIKEKNKKKSSLFGLSVASFE